MHHATPDVSLRAGPADPVELLRRGRAQLHAGDAAAAAETLRRATVMAPGFAAVHGALGAALLRLGRFEDAVASHERAVLLAPRSPEAWSDLASAWLRFGRAEAAVQGFRMAVRLAPQAAALRHNLGTALLRTGDLEGAAAALREAVALEPGLVGARVNLGAALRRAGAAAAAVTVLREAVRLDPEDADAQWNLALALLMADGPGAEGWERYEWRLRRPGAVPQRPGSDEWDGAPDGALTLLLRSEQGLGDTLQFLSYARAARVRVGRIVLEAPPALVPLLGSALGVDEVVPRGGSVPAHDVHAPLMSLPHRLRRPLPPADGAWLRADPARVARWRARLPQGGLRVAIGWQGNPAYEDDHRRSIPLLAFAPLAERPDVHLVAVQKQHGREQLDAWPADRPLLDLGPELDEDGAFLDTAAVLTAADLVVTSDTALAHVAGALGVPTWVVLSHAPDWRWGLTGETCPWYANVRLFRQPAPGDWPGAFGAVAAALAGRAATRGDR